MFTPAHNQFISMR